jgi:hypothetical protein
MARSIVATKQSRKPPGVRVGLRLVVIRDGRFLCKQEKKGRLAADSKGGPAAATG